MKTSVDRNVLRHFPRVLYCAVLRNHIGPFASAQKGSAAFGLCWILIG